MNQKPRMPTESLIERAAEVYDFGGLFRSKSVSLDRDERSGEEQAATGATSSGAPSLRETAPFPPAGSRAPSLTSATPVDLQHLRASGFIVPGAPPTALSEEFRLVKRQLLLTAFGSASAPAAERGRTILVCSAQPNEGKTFCSVNLALSMASETDTQVLLIDADVAKPEILSTLGLPGGAGLMDALADPSIDPESLVIRTDIANLSVLPAGKQSNHDTELLASARTRDLIDRLAGAHPRRILLFDSAPALAASPASVLALHVGQVLMVVRADHTSESELRDALTMVDACPRISLMLNAVTFSGSNRKFGSYYGFGD